MPENKGTECRVGCNRSSMKRKRQLEELSQTRTFKMIDLCSKKWKNRLLFLSMRRLVATIILRELDKHFEWLKTTQYCL